MIRAPGHVKYIVDTINDYDKRYLKEQTCMVVTSEVDGSTKRMKTHAMVRKKKSSWVIT